MRTLLALVLAVGPARARGMSLNVQCSEPQVVPLPPSSGDAVLYGLKVAGPTGFAVGYYWDTADVCNSAGTYGSCTRPLIETYADGAWSFTLPEPPKPTPKGGAADLVNSWLYAIDGTSPSDLWALGTI